MRDQEVCSNEGGATPPRGERVGDALPSALVEFHRALQSMSIYPIGHPAVAQAVGRAWSELTTALAGRGSTLLGVARDHLLIDRVPIDDARAALAPLAQLLHSLDVAVVELRSDLTASDLERFLFRVREARQKGRGGDALALVLAEDKLESIRIFPLDYWSLSFRSYADRERNGRETADVWDGLVVNLTDLALSNPGADPETLAEQANERFVAEDGVGNGVLREQMRTLGRSLSGMEDWQREALRSRLSRFVGALNPHLRQDLLRVDPQDSGDWLGVMAELSDTLPDAALLDVLRDLNRAGHRAHDQFLNFMNKIARIPSQNSDRAVDLDGVLDRWRVSGVIEEDPGAFRRALREVFSRRRAIECNPEPYQELLDELTHREVAPVMRTLTARYRDPSDALDVRSQATELAIHLLADGDAGEHAPGLLAHVGAATDELLDAGRFQPVRDAAVVARAICAHDTTADEARRAAAGYLRDFTLATRIDRILDNACRDGSVSAAVEPLLALGGVAALQRIVDRLDQSPGSLLSGVLRNVAVGLGRGPMAQVLAARSDEGWARLRPAFPVVRLLPTADAVSLLVPLLSHGEPRVRHETLLALCELDAEPGSPERHLRVALHDSEGWIVSSAIDRLAARGSAEGLAILGAYLAGATADRAAVLQHARRVSRALLAGGSAGRERAAACLDRYRWALFSTRRRIGCAIRSELAAAGDDPAVAPALARWSRSPARWISRAFAALPAPEDRA